MNGTKADVGVRRRKSTRREWQARTGQQGVNLALGRGKRSDLAVCQEVFPSTFPWDEPCPKGGFLGWGVGGKQVFRQLLWENKGVAWV